MRRLDEWAGNGLRAGGFAQQSFSTANGRVRLAAGLRWGQYAQYPELQFLFSRFGSGFPIPGFYRREGQKYYRSQFRNALRVDSYRRVDVRINKAFVFDHWKLTLYAEVVNLLNRANYRFDALRGYNSNNARAHPRFDRMFPILPSAGVVLEFGGG